MKIEKLEQDEYKQLVADTLGKQIRIEFVEGDPTAQGLTGLVQTVSEDGKLRGTWGQFALDCALDKWVVLG